MASAKSLPSLRRVAGYDRPQRFGILGCARNVPFTILKPKQENPDLNSRMEIVGIASADAAEAESRAKEWGIVKAYKSLDELLADPVVDCIYNCTPVGVRCEWTIKALLAGKHVMSETPVCSNAYESLAMQRAAEDHGKLLLEGTQAACHPVTQRVRELILQNAVGAVEHIDLSLPLGHALDGKMGCSKKGALMSLGCHGVGIARALTGENPVVVSATAQRMKEDPDVDESMSCNLKFPCGAAAHLMCSVTKSSEEHPTLFTVTGSTGTIRVKEWFTGESRGANEIELDLYEETGEKIKERLNMKASQNTFYFQLRALIEEINDQERRQVVGLPWCYTRAKGPEDAVRNMAVIDAIYRAAGMQPKPSTALVPAPYDAVFGLAKL